MIIFKINLKQTKEIDLYSESSIEGFVCLNN